MIAIMVISHEPLGTALISCTRHILGKTPSQVAALDVIPDEDPVLALSAARELMARISDGSGLLVLTDLFGATPSRIARELFVPHRVAVVAGANLPMLVKAMSLRRTAMPLTELVDQILVSGRDAIYEVLPETFEKS
jgi:mannose PTS system EIIA component